MSNFKIDDKEYNVVVKDYKITREKISTPGDLMNFHMANKIRALETEIEMKIANGKIDMSNWKPDPNIVVCTNMDARDLAMVELIRKGVY